ncbi:NAD(P)-binding domain-containing protein [Corynebacterium sp. HMSC11H10]|uniref:NADPH-dependent F420 reductase n=1 Tax=Corynebacterium sp. ACRPX TaxID=2918185 RepID=UPI0009F72058
MPPRSQAETTPPDIQTIGIVGVGKLGSALGQVAAAAGFKILATSRPGPMREAIISTVLPTTTVVDYEELASLADVVIFAVPNTEVANFDLSKVRGTIIDATNPWEATGTNSAESVTTADLAKRSPGAHIAKTLNHVSYEELISDYRTPEEIAEGAPRRAIAVMSTDPAALEAARATVEAFGFEPVPVDVSVGKRFRPDGDLFGACLSADQMRQAVEE